MELLKSIRWVTLLSCVGALSACGGGSSDDQVTEETGTTISGTALKPKNATIAARSWYEDALAVLGSIISESRAGVDGLEAVPKGTPIRLVRLNTDGTVAETLAQAEVDSNGQFSFNTDANLDSDTVIELGSGSSRMRGPPDGQSSDVNPVTEKAVAEVVSRVGNTTTFDDYSPDEIASVAALAEKKLEAEQVNVDGSSVDAAVTTVEDNAGSEINSNTDAAEADNASTFSGNKHLVAHQLELQSDEPDEAQFAGNGIYTPASVTSDGELTFDSKAEERGVERQWQLGGSINSSFNSYTTTAGPIQGGSALLQSDGTFAVPVGDDSTLRGLRSSDGDLLAGVTRDSLVIGANERASTPSNLSQGFNAVAITSYVDEKNNNGEAGAQVRLRTDISVSCSSGTCDITINDDFSNRKFYAQDVPSESNGTATAEATNRGTFTVSGVSLSDDGHLDGSGEFRASGFVAPGDPPGLMVLQISGLEPNKASANGFPYVTTYIAVPNGSCPGDGSTFSGAYNTAALNTEVGRDDSQDPPTEFDLKTEDGVANPDGSGGGTVGPSEETLRSQQFPIASDGDVEAMVSESGTSDSSTSFSYSVDSSCILNVEDTSGLRVVGAVSPNGDVAVVGEYTKQSSPLQAELKATIAIKQ